MPSDENERRKLGALLKALRTKKGKSQDQVADLFGNDYPVTQPLISKYEKGKLSPPPIYLREFRLRLKLSNKDNKRLRRLYKAYLEKRKVEPNLAEYDGKTEQ